MSAASRLSRVRSAGPEVPARDARSDPRTAAHAIVGFDVHWPVVLEIGKSARWAGTSGRLEVRRPREPARRPVIAGGFGGITGTIGGGRLQPLRRGFSPAMDQHDRCRRGVRRSPPGWPLDARFVTMRDADICHLRPGSCLLTPARLAFGFGRGARQLGHRCPRCRWRLPCARARRSRSLQSGSAGRRTPSGHRARRRAAAPRRTR